MSRPGQPAIALRCALEGTGGRGLVLLHELGGSLESFDGVVPALECGFRILRYDQRGCGLSEKPRRPFTLADHVADLSRLLGQSGLEPPFCLAGVAAGAAIAAAFTLAHPRHVAALAMCAPALAVTPERRAYLAERSEMAVREGMRAIVDATLARSYPEFLRQDRAAFEAYRARFLANDPVGYAQANRALAEARLEQKLGRLDLPCLVLAGAHDLLRPPEEVRAVARRLPRVEFAVVESGHLMSVQAPAAMAARLGRFFAEATVSPRR